ncbi:MAG: hypothetical protein JO202_17560 [Ktedonobacteraceae bacterium]|nr:hypothetical protein [Ktedonobacteraceae bacterium]
MSEPIYWGEGGQYGPFTLQADGWPNAGEVVRHYRKQANLSASEVAQRYTHATGKPVATTWILDMESKNKVPNDITRRRALADILAIPPVLLGLASREQVVLHPTGQARSASAVPTILKSAAASADFDVTKYEKTIRLLWQLHYTSSAHDTLEDVMSAIRALEGLRQQASGSLLKRIEFLLYSHYRLAAVVYRDQGQFSKGSAYASDAVSVAKDLEVKGLNKEDVLAVALYSRGYGSLEWGMLGEKTPLGVVTFDYTKVLSAIRDFEDALNCASRPRLQGLIKGQLSRAQAFFAMQGGKVVYPSLVTLAKGHIKTARDMVGDSQDDPYLQIFLDGTIGGLSEGRYLLDMAVTYNLIGLSGRAEEIIDDELERALPRNRIRQNAWMQIVRAHVALKQRDFFTATSMATSAFLACQDIHCVKNLAIINDIHSQLLKVKGMKVDEQAVYDLGVMLAGYYVRLSYT